ncbi:sensor domain-containing diguanylate cyclase [Pseudomonas saliphila]|uniref:sensor domain-containing diguanylate cyclase n=1 Tax=Pseudomonas saliphila TaxID=2586906 RepID=UPI00123AFF16|nr:GGDEF domain-containing protein [Pseudomonas saliphila]
MIASTRFRPFSRRLLVKLSALALIAMLLVSITQAVLINRSERQNYQALVKQLTSTQIPLLQTALWDVELGTIDRQLQRIAGLPPVAAVHLLSDTGLDIRAGEPSVQSQPADAILLIPSPFDTSVPLGELHIYYQHERVMQQIMSSIVQRILEFSLYTLLIFLVLFRALQSELGRPLNQIAEYVSSLKPQRHPPGLKLPRRTRDWHDEIDLIVDGFDTLRKGMSHYSEQHECVMQALASERDSLDLHVARRTREFAQLNSYLRLITDKTLSLMNLNHAEYPEALRDTLAALCQYRQFDACALLDQQAGEPSRYRLGWMQEKDPVWIEQIKALDISAGEPDWSIQRLSERTLLIRFIGPQTSFCCALRDAPGTFEPTGDELTLGTGQWLFSLVQHWDHVIGLDQARQELIQMSHTDPLTGLANRRHFEAHQLGELRRASRLGYAASLLMIDVDYFKGFNDLYGHSAGDDCLKALGALLIGSFKRAGELPSRMGGEEFAVLLPGYDLEGAVYAAEALRRSIHALAIPHEGSIWGQVTVSIGCASWQGTGEPDKVIESLLNTADAALYEAKRLGRNRVATPYSSDSPSNDVAGAPVVPG